MPHPFNYFARSSLLLFFCKPQRTELLIFTSFFCTLSHWFTQALQMLNSKPILWQPCQRCLIPYQQTLWKISPRTRRDQRPRAHLIQEPPCTQALQKDVVILGQEARLKVRSYPFWSQQLIISKENKELATVSYLSGYQSLPIKSFTAILWLVPSWKSTCRLFLIFSGFTDSQLFDSSS